MKKETKELALSWAIVIAIFGMITLVVYALEHSR